MDAIKTEPESDSCDDIVTDEALANSPPDESSAVVESKESNYDVKWEIKIEETAVPVTFPVMKCEPEEETFGTVRVKQEIQLDVVMEKFEVLTERK
ncbi:uncharacterized protein [Periplaneta americana]|uniref:uncharacterized protein isoform X2 n=1 Tax=Periplaneta americana TaxID=6978 RepID=UPI0037E975E2